MMENPNKLDESSVPPFLQKPPYVTDNTMDGIFMGFSIKKKTSIFGYPHDYGHLHMGVSLNGGTPKIA